MSQNQWIAHNLWVIPLLPLAAAVCIGLLGPARRASAAMIATVALGLAFLFSLWAFLVTLFLHQPVIENFRWFQAGAFLVQLGMILDPLTAVMLVMVSLVGTLIFIFSAGYMREDPRFGSFFALLSFFGAAMLGLVIANSLLMLFVCWELVGLASYLLIGFWHERPAAAAAAKKAFITTRVGDLAFFAGLLWLQAETGSLLFYDQGRGCLEAAALNSLMATAGWGGAAVCTVIALLIFCGAAGKSGQVPLHVWLPDAMEGPTPVSALIHAATMVAAGVFLVARIYPLMDADPLNIPGSSTALTVVAFTGAITAVFAALIAVAQTDIKRVLAYSTVSQLGYMMLGLGVGGPGVAMFHLVAHGFFKALLFLGAGSVIHACGHEQDIRRMGGLKGLLPITFATYAIGMMALIGVPLFFSGFWSKDEILHAALGWKVSLWPFYLGLLGAFLTAFYMTRQVLYVFYGTYRNIAPSTSNENHARAQEGPQESPRIMLIPLVILAFCAIALSIAGTPAWPWFHDYLAGHLVELKLSRLWEREFLIVVLFSTSVLGAGVWLGWWFYRPGRLQAMALSDPLEDLQPTIFGWARDRFFVDELYQNTVVRFQHWASHAAITLDNRVWNAGVRAVTLCALGLAWVSRCFDELAVNRTFDFICQRFRDLASVLSHAHSGQIQVYLRVLALTLGGLFLLLILS